MKILSLLTWLPRKVARIGLWFALAIYANYILDQLRRNGKYVDDQEFREAYREMWRWINAICTKSGL